MSFQLSVGATVPVPRPPLATSGPAPVAPVALATAVPAGIKVTNIDDYAALAEQYKDQIAGYSVSDQVSIEWRKRLESQALVLRSEFEGIGRRLKALQDEYMVLSEHDGNTHEMRELSYDNIMAKFNSLPPDDRPKVYRPPTEIQSRVNANDTSQKFRGRDGQLTGPITEQALDRSPDWLDSFSDMVSAVLDGWTATSDDALLSVPATNEVQRSRRSLTSMVRAHVQTHMDTTWKPAVMLARGETIKQNVRCAYDWNDMYAPDAATSAPMIKPVAVRASPVPVPTRSRTPTLPEPPRVEATYVTKQELGTAGLERLSISALTEIGNTVEADLRANTIKQVAAESVGDVAARAQRLAGVGVGVATPWYKK